MYSPHPWLLAILMVLLPHLSLGLSQEVCANMSSSHKQTIATASATEVATTTNAAESGLEHPNKEPPGPLRVAVDMFSPKQLEVVEKFLFDIDNFSGKYSLAQVNHMALTAKAHIIYDDMLIHRYDNYDDLKDSGGPEANQEACLRELEALEERAQTQGSQKMASQDINFHQLMDTYGRSPAGVLLLNTVWPGMMDECQRLKIDTPNGRLDTRYCIASFKFNKWPETGAIGNYFAMKTGVCLPKVCDSINYKNKYRLIERLIDFNSREIDKGQYNVTSVYCIPDDESKIRTWWRSSECCLFVAACLGWLSVIVFASVKYNNFVKQKTTSENKRAGTSELAINIYRSLSIGHNLKQLFTINDPPPVEIKAKGASEKVEVEGKVEKKLIVDLRIIEGIKVVCMSYIILGHVLMCFSKICSNTREFAENGVRNLAYIAANLMPAFAVNAFFCITGILTTFMIFKKHQGRPFMSDPVKWVALIFYRYLRIMPMYVIVVAYLKYAARFTGSGPSWDYGTSALSPRRKCEQEPWLVVLGFLANFKSPLEHCIPSAWYLANDFQFFCVTPIFMIVLNWRPEWGRKLLKLCIGLGCLAGVINIFSTEVPDLKPIMDFMPHGFLTHVIFLSTPYTGPIYRIPAYLCGLLIGYELFSYEQRKIKYLERRLALPPSHAEEGREEDKEATGEEQVEQVEEEEPTWAKWLIEWGPALSLFSFLIFTALPLICPYLPFNHFFTRLAVALFWPLFHIIFSLATGGYILLASTGHGNQLVNQIMSAKVWKPLARLSLCVVLINIGVVDYLRQTRSYQVQADLSIHLTGNMYSIFMTYLVATLVYVLFEAPMGGLLNHVFNMLVNKSSIKQKSN